MKRTVRVIIEGRVQGVSYRDWTRGEALRLGLRGWVRNQPDGTVEAVFSGEPHDVEAMLRACREGPPAARVRDVHVQPLAEAELADAFDIRLS